MARNRSTEARRCHDFDADNRNQPRQQLWPRVDINSSDIQWYVEKAWKGFILIWLQVLWAHLFFVGESDEGGDHPPFGRIPDLGRLLVPSRTWCWSWCCRGASPGRNCWGARQSNGLFGLVQWIGLGENLQFPVKFHKISLKPIYGLVCPSFFHLLFWTICATCRRNCVGLLL